MRFLAFSLTALSCVAADPEEARLNRFTFGMRLDWNVGVTFSGIGGIPPVSSPGVPGIAGINRTYDDGFVRVDSEGNAGGLTWNWGYRDASQLSVPGSLRMSSHEGIPSGSSKPDTGDPQLGFEAAWLRELGNGQYWRAGFKGAFGVSGLNVEDRAVVASHLQKTTDS